MYILPCHHVPYKYNLKVSHISDVSCDAISEHKKASFAQTIKTDVTMTVRIEQRNSVVKIKFHEKLSVKTGVLSHSQNNGHKMYFL